MSKTPISAILRAKDPVKPCPVHINIHGGGFVIGHAQRDIVFCSKLAALTGGVLAVQVEREDAQKMIIDAIKGAGIGG